MGDGWAALSRHNHFTSEMGPKTVLTALKRHFRITPRNGHRQRRSACLKRARNRDGPHSISSSVLAGMVGLRSRAGLSQPVSSPPLLRRSRLCEHVSGLAAPVAKQEFNGTGADVFYLFDWSDTTVHRIRYETYDNRTSNCTRSSKYVSICGRHIELQYSSRSPGRQRRHGPRPCGNQASEHLLQEFARAHYA
jgi:hypothetical protein